MKILTSKRASSNASLKYRTL